MQEGEAGREKLRGSGSHDHQLTLDGIRETQPLVNDAKPSSTVYMYACIAAYECVRYVPKGIFDMSIESKLAETALL